jgi:hypothetical protein
MAKKRPIDKVTVGLLDTALRLVDIEIHEEILSRVLDVVKLLEKKGNRAHVEDMTKLQALWRENSNVVKYTKK